jgi:DNA-binding transcriptional ArsR family regulator
LDIHFHTLQSVEVKLTALKPTLWRTCRVLANHTRLQLFASLIRRQRQSVTELAEQLKLTVPVASQSLRALESRGLLEVRRIRRRVEYRIPDAADAAELAALIATLRKTVRGGEPAFEQIMKAATGFTHPARIAIVRALNDGEKNFAEIQFVTRLSAPALSRHLGKLIRRGFIRADDVRHCFAVSQNTEGVAKCLLQLVTS